ncbi:MAG: hypothetical protein ACRC2T_09155 [Thermoguttaceae bacterium]
MQITSDVGYEQILKLAMQLSPSQQSQLARDITSEDRGIATTKSQVCSTSAENKIAPPQSHENEALKRFTNPQAFAPNLINGDIINYTSEEEWEVLQ